MEANALALQTQNFNAFAHLLMLEFIAKQFHLSPVRIKTIT
jgi:hypothetical protein